MNRTKKNILSVIITLLLTACIGFTVYQIKSQNTPPAAPTEQMQQQQSGGNSGSSTDKSSSSDNNIIKGNNSNSNNNNNSSNNSNNSNQQTPPEKPSESVSNSDGCNLNSFKSIQRCAPMPICPPTSTPISNNKTKKYTTYEYFKYTLTSSKAKNSINPNDTPKRINCFAAHGVQLPLAAE